MNRRVIQKPRDSIVVYHSGRSRELRHDCNVIVNSREEDMCIEITPTRLGHQDGQSFCVDGAALRPRWLTPNSVPNWVQPKKIRVLDVSSHYHSTVCCSNEPSSRQKGWSVSAPNPYILLSNLKIWQTSKIINNRQNKCFRKFGWHSVRRGYTIYTGILWPRVYFRGVYRIRVRVLKLVDARRRPCCMLVQVETD
jgi:hypothetical protein